MSIHQLSKNELKDMFTKAVYNRGLNYYREGRVRNLYHDPLHNRWSATVLGSTSYEVTIVEDDPNFSSECTCPAYEKYWHPCKHIAAVMLKIYDHEQNTILLGDSTESNQRFLDLQRKKEENERRKQQELVKQKEERQAIYVKQLTNQFIQKISSYSSARIEQENEKTKTILQVEWFLKAKKPYYSSHEHLIIEMKIGQKRTYVVKKMKDFLQAISNKSQYPFTKAFTYDPAEHSFSADDQEIITLLLNCVNDEEMYHKFYPSYYHSPDRLEDREFSISPMFADKLLIKLNSVSTSFNFGEGEYEQVTVHQNALPLSIKLDKGKETGFQMDITEVMFYNVLELYGYLYKADQFYKLSSDGQRLINELKKMNRQSKSAKIPIAQDQIELFVSQVVPIIGKIAQVEITDHVSNQLVKSPLKAKIYVDLLDEWLNVKVQFHYGEHMIDPFNQKPQSTDSPIIMREVEGEQAIIDVLESATLKYNGDRLYIEDEEEIVDFIYSILPLLEEKADIYLTNAVKSLISPEKHAPVTNIEVNASSNLLDISFDMGGIEQEEVQRILQSVVEKKKYYRLPNGAFVSLETDEFQTIRKFMDEFHLKQQLLQQKSIQLPLYKGIQLDEMIQNGDGDKVKYGKQFRRLLKRLKNPETLDFDLPENLHAELRDYQNVGFQWFKSLRYYNLGGILADDMGLGKTLQSIAFIQSLFNEEKDAKSALIVAPASLVYNWKNEFQKFAPSLKVQVMIGSPEERMEKFQSGEVSNVWITSYPTLRQDIDSYQQMQFSTFILDEAQVIKNYATKTARAARQIQAETCFALSGTPIENSIDELWSIFQPVMPGFFPNQKSFRQLEPEKIAKMIRPFLLRRLKKDVLKELPDKIETVNYSELTKGQKQLYVAYLEKIQRETKESLQSEGFQKSQIKILAGLTRLRQLCCHPSLFLENYDGDSGKLEQLMDIVGTAKENGRRMLIFSQFTSMLSIIREKLNKANVNCFYLDGQTKPKERVNMVDQFNQGNGDVFLISLKAGNTGLNLTSADTVILYDLWWNPAVEDQAAGRAHRFGQKNVVQVIRLLTQGTIEEKIYELQLTKKELIDKVVQTGDQAISKLTEQEIREILNI